MDTIPYKHIKTIAKRYGYQRLKHFKQRDANRYKATVGSTGARIMVNTKSEEVFLWNPFMKKLVKQ